MRLADEPLQKITINIYESDYFWFLKRYKHGGYQEKIREIIREFREVYDLEIENE